MEYSHAQSRFPSGSTSIAASYYHTDDRSGVPPVVVILTGDGLKGSQSSTWPPVIADFLERGLDVFIFDFEGQGLSEGKRETLSLTTGRRNFLDALNHLGAISSKRGARLGLFGSSFGASVILHSLNGVRQRVDCIAFKSPAVDLAAAYECDHGSLAELLNWKESQISSLTGLAYSTYLEALKVDLLQHTGLVACPVLIVHGAADQIVPVHQSWRLANALGAHASLRELPGVGHGYKEPGALDSLVTHVGDFLSQHLRR